jgi:hypothetical protein
MTGSPKEGPKLWLEILEFVAVLVLMTMGIAACLVGLFYVATGIACWCVDDLPPLHIAAYRIVCLAIFPFVFMCCLLEGPRGFR